MEDVINDLKQGIKKLEEKLKIKYCMTIDKDWIEKENKAIKKHIKETKTAIKILQKKNCASDEVSINNEALLCIGLNDKIKQIHTAAKEKGFWDSERQTGTLLMLCVSELAEALEADRIDKVANLKALNENFFKASFEDHIKDTFEDELADTVIRILDLCGARGINLEKHIDLKLRYNLTRERMYSKNY